MAMKYTIIRCDSIEEIIDETNKMLHDGWLMFGQMSVCKDEQNLSFYIREFTRTENPYGGQDEKTTSQLYYRHHLKQLLKKDKMKDQGDKDEKTPP